VGFIKLWGMPTTVHAGVHGSVAGANAIGSEVSVSVSVVDATGEPVA
jgi:hypothetical protein